MSVYLTVERLREVLIYEPESGRFTWRIYRASNAKAGELAGTSDRGYVKIWIDGRQYRAHRLAWLYMTGCWPEHEIDHENRNKSDTTWTNLRPATRKQNQENQGLLARNKSGHRGVSWNQKERAWHAQIKHNRKNLHLGWFKSLPAAVEARHAAELKLFTHSQALQ